LKSIYHICKTPHNVRETRKALGSRLRRTCGALTRSRHSSECRLPLILAAFAVTKVKCFIFLAFLTLNALETLNDTRGNDLGHGNNDKDDKHTNILTSCFEIGNPRENHLSSLRLEYGGPSTTTRMHKAKDKYGLYVCHGCRWKMMS